jgi:hypothetical protein
MDNKYLDYLQSNPQAADPAPTVNQPTANPYSEYLQSEKRKALRSSMVSAMDVEPDAAGKARRLAQQSGIPAAVVERNLPDVERQVQLQQFDGLVTESPRLANELQNPEFAKIARDDLDVLKRMESKLYGGMKPIERGFFGAITEPVQRGFARARGSISIIASELGLYDGAPEELAVNLAQRNREVERFPMPANVADGLAEITQYSRLGETAKAAGAIVRNPLSVIEVALESLGASSPAIAAFAVGSAFGPAGRVVGSGVGSFAVEYANTINEVVTESGGSTTDAFSIGRAMANPEVMEAAREKALKRGIPIALFDALTAGVAGRLLAGATSSTGSVAARTAGELGIQAAGGAAGEATAQGLTGEFNPGEILLEAFAEIPTAIIEVPANYRDARGAARMRDTIAAAEKVQQQIQAQVNQAQGAEQNAQVLRDMAADSTASKARERDPKAFEQYIDRVVEDGPVQDLYIDAQTLVNKLNQSGISVAELSQASPSVAAQLPEALAAGGDIVIPVSEYMARVAGTGLDEALIPSLRTDVSAMSEEQAQVFYQEQTQVFQQEAERVIGQQAQTDAFMESADQVEGQLLEQLNKAGRFQPRANELKASFAKSFYSTLADTLGVTPTEAFERYPLQIRADFLPDLAGGGRFDQAKADEPIMDFEQAREYFKANLQGKEIDRPGLGKVRITGKGWKKFKGGVKADPSKTDLLQFIPDVIQSGEYIGRFPLDKVRSDDIVAFHHIQKTVQLRGNDVRVGVTLGEDQFGNLFYNINRDPDALLQKKKGSDVTGEIAPGSEPSEGANTLSQSVLDDGSEVNIEILEQGERGSIAFGNDITQTPSVLTLAAGSDLSTFFHESGHFFLEVYSDLASRPDAPARVQSDMAAILDWMGVKGSPELTPLQQWRAMSIDERRPMHEKFARGFEAYLIKGEAPSLELRDAFRTFSAWIKNVYKNLLAQFRGNTDRALDTNLSPEIRQVMDRMLATDAQIQQAEFARSMFPTFQTAEEAGMNQEQWEAYQAQGKDATATAVEQLQRKSLADMKWFANAKGKAIRQMQKRAKEVRAQVRTDVRREVMTQPVYQAWAFFRSRLDMPANQPKPKAQNRELNPAVDSLFVAIGMLGGLDKDQLVGTWGFDPADRAESGVFGKPVVRANKGRTLDDMLSALAEWGYLPVDENGKPDLRDFEEAFFNELAGDPQYSMWADYSLQREDEAPEVAFDLANIPSGKISTSWLKAKYSPDEAWRKLTALKMTSEATGLDPDVVAPAFDFDSGDAMVQALIAAEDPSLVIERLTDQRMLQEFSELATPEQIERSAEAAIHNEARARFVATELEAVNQLNNAREKTTRGGTVNVIMKAAREFAEDILSRKKLRDIKPGQFANAEAKAGRQADAAQRAGDYNAMAQAKRNQLLNAYAARGAVKALEEAEQTLKYLRKFDRDTVRKGLPPEYQDQIDAILEDIGLRAMSNKQIDRLKSLDAWVKQQNELGFTVDIDQRLLDRAAQKQFRELTLQEMRAIRDAIKNIEHLGRKKKQYQVARDLRNFEDVRDEVLATIEESGGKSKVVPFKTEKGSMADFGKSVRSFFAVNRKLSSLIQQMDGGKDGGIFWQAAMRRFNDAADYRQELQDQYFPKLEALLNRLEKSTGKLLEKRFIQGLGFSLDTETRMAILLNWGNEQGRARILEGLKKPNGELFTTAQVQTVLQTFTAEELQIANDMWALIDEFWPLIVEKQKRVTGIEPGKVEALPFTMTSADGQVVQVRGGYYPLKYDNDKDGGRQNQLDTAATFDELKRGAFAHASTRRGHVEKRAETVERPIRLDLNVAVEHIVQVTQDLAFHEAIVDVSRLLNDRKIKSIILEKYGQEVWDTMSGAMVTIAQDGVLQTERWLRLGNRLRNNVSRAIMGASMTTAFLQPFGFFNSMAKIGPRWVLNGIGNALSDAAKFESSTKWVGEKSTFMRARARTFNAEMNSINSKLNGRSQLLQMYDTALFFTMQKLQVTVDVPTWIGAYNKALSEGREEDTAVALADQAVIDSQGSGLVKDQTEFQLNHPFLTQFYSYFAATYNLLAQRTGNTDFKNPRALMGWMSDVFFLVVLPSIAAEMVKAALKGDLEDDEPEDIALKSAKWLTGYTLGMLPFVRDLGTLITGFDYAGPPVARIITNLADTSIQVKQGEVDQAMVGAFARTLGSLTGVPDVQLMRTYKGWVAWEEGEAPATSILLGPPSRD